MVGFCAPAWLHVPAHVGSYGAEVCDLGAAVGMTLDPEQRLVVDATYAYDEDGRLVSTELGCAAPRQNVKTHVAKVEALADLVLFAEPDCLWTAHLRETAYEAFRNSEGTGLADLFDAHDWLRRLVDDITDSDGERSITLLPRSAGGPRPTLRFMTRSERGGRGLTGRRVTFDEALFLKPSMTSAMVPILSARSMTGQVQVRYLGSPGLQHSQTWREVRDRGRAGTARALAWIEWAAPRVRCGSPDCVHAVGAEGCALDREDLVRAANLAIGRRMDIRFVMETERAAMTPEDFMRERLGWWDDPVVGGGVLDLDGWGRLGVGAQADMRAPVLAVEVALDRSSATIGAVWAVAGKPHAEVVEDRPGMAGLLGRVIELARKYAVLGVVLDMDTEAAGLAPGLEAAGVRVLPVNRSSRVAACGVFYDAATTAAMTHSGDPAMTEAIKSARWKDAGDGARAFSRRRSAGDIGALYVVVLALWGWFELTRADRPSVYEGRGVLTL